jgi:hypothetical protein
MSLAALAVHQGMARDEETLEPSVYLNKWVQLLCFSSAAVPS